MSFKHCCLKIRVKNFHQELIKDDPNAEGFCTGFENYDAMIAEFECLEPKASRMHFGHGRDKCNDGTLQQFFIILV